MALSPDALKNLLIKAEVISETEFKRAEERSRQSGIPVTRLLISEGRLTQQYLNELVSKFLDVPVFDIRSTPPKLETIQLVPESIARQRQILVFDADQEKHSFKVALADPTNVETLNYLREYLKGDIHPYLTTVDDLRSGYQLYQKEAANALEAIIADKIKAISGGMKGSEGTILESVPIVELFDRLLDYASLLQASDIYFQPEEDSLKVRFRIDGLLREVLSIDKSINDGVVARVKALANLRVDEHLKPQDGRFRFHSSDTDIDVRCAVMPTFFGEKTTLRLLTGAQAFVAFEELGMDAATILKLKETAKRPYGMLLSSGPTGSGKTTTIYAILSLLNRPEVHIATIEDPIEYLVPNVSQTQVNLQAEVTFASGLRAILRHSPDIIFIGEIRDHETADVSVNAALTGHLLISTIHTNNAPSTIIRLIDLGIPSFLIAATLNAILAQRLVRKICLNCIESTTVEEGVVKRIEAEFAKIGRKPRIPTVFFHGRGCAVCGHTGYHGRTGIFEVFILDEETRRVISERNTSLEHIQAIAEKQGMVTMLEDGLNKVEQGMTTAQELLRVISE